MFLFFKTGTKLIRENCSQFLSKETNGSNQKWKIAFALLLGEEADFKLQGIIHLLNARESTKLVAFRFSNLYKISPCKNCCVSQVHEL